MKSSGRRTQVLLLAAALLSGAAGQARAGAVRVRNLKDFERKLSTVTLEQRERINESAIREGPMVLKSTDMAGSAVGPGYTLIPLPAFTYNRNEGSWIGALTPIFRANEKGQVEDIYAPLYLHNEFIGETFTFNYFGYRHETTQHHVVLSYATKIEHSIDVAYKNVAALDGRYIVEAQANSGKSAFNRFFGGNNSPQSNESQYTMGDSLARLAGGFHLTDELSLIGAVRYRNVTIENGASPTLPQLTDKFSTLAGVEAPNVLGHGATLSYDTRDNQLTPLRGTYWTLFAEYDQNIEFTERNRWWRMTAQWRSFFPHAGNRMVFVPRVLLDGVAGQDQNEFSAAPDSRRLVRRGVPFYEKPALGGETTLRGFGRNRFIGNAAYLINLEERISLARRSIMGNLIELEVAPFVDIGRVTSALDVKDIIKAAQVNPGVGLRLLARPNIAGRMDVGYGRDGTGIYVGLDYPF